MRSRMVLIMHPSRARAGFREVALTAVGELATAFERSASGCTRLGRRRPGNSGGPVVGYESGHLVCAEFPDRPDRVIVITWDQRDRDRSVRPGLGVGIALGACRGQVAVSTS